MIKICPHCNMSYCVSNNNQDTEHDCNSGDEVLDNEDYFRLNVSSWNLQGTANKVGLYGRLLTGAREGNINVRGKNSDIYGERKHYEIN